MPDSKPESLDDPRVEPGAVSTHDAVEYARARKLRGRNIALFLALLCWVLVIYIAFMVKIHGELYP